MTSYLPILHTHARPRRAKQRNDEKQDIPGLAMSRSLGDAVAHSVGVSSVPEVVERRVDPKSEHFLVSA